MAKILIAWELGANFGHLARELPIARLLRASGHQLLFAVRDVATARDILTPAGMQYLQAPAHFGRTPLRRPPTNYSELLLAEGYGDLGGLHARVLAWKSLFELHGTQAVIADHAPTAMLAARAAHLPIIAVGNGFEIPPNASPLPNLRPWRDVPEAELRRSDEIACRLMNECLRRFDGAPPLEQVTDLFTGSAQILATFRELDPFGERGDAISYCGPLFGPVGAVRVQWQSERRPRVLVYLRNGTPGLKNMLASLKTMGVEVICVLPGIGRRMSGALSSGPFRVVPQGIQLDSLIGGADVVVHGGTGTAAQALLAGVAVLTLPANIEQYLHAKRVEALGAGVAIGNARSREDLSAALTRVMSEPTYIERAREFAERHATFRPAMVAEHAVAVVERSLAEGAGSPLH